jgi:hypothetical protein
MKGRGLAALVIVLVLDFLWDFEDENENEEEVLLGRVTPHSPRRVFGCIMVM